MELVEPIFDLADCHQSGAVPTGKRSAVRQRELVLGPFQGKVACVRIAVVQGVCGTAVQRNATLVVPEVHEFPGHIACDVESRSEIVVPLRYRQRVVGVLDIDSPRLTRFDQRDAAALEAAVEMFIQSSDLHILLD